MATNDEIFNEAATTADFTFDRGDVNIKVRIGENIIMGKVCSAAMALASPVWKKFIFPPWGSPTLEDKVNQIISETDRNAIAAAGMAIFPINHVASLPVAELDFTEDDVGALLFLLRIAHLRFDKISSGISEMTLYHASLLCDQYQCAYLLKPWVCSWFDDDKFTARLYQCQEITNESLLFVFWTFGRVREFRDLARNLVNNTSVDHEGNYLASNGARHEGPEPPEIMNNILSERLLTIERLLRLPYDLVDKFLAPGGLGNIICASSECDAMVFGSLIKSLQEISLWPVQEPKDILTSAKQLETNIDFIQVLAMHPKCKEHFNFAKKTREAIRATQCPVAESHRIHMLRKDI